jgi:hypothetical protein
MMLSSRGGEAGRVDAEGAVVSEEGSEDVDAAAGEADEAWAWV